VLLTPACIAHPVACRNRTRNILLYHMLPGIVRAPQLPTGGLVKTLLPSGPPLYIGRNSSGS
jgi:hypothetical protein